MRYVKLAVVWVFVFFPLTGFAQSIRVSYVGTTGTNAPLWVTQEAGFLKKHGLTTDLILISGGSTIIQALLAQEIAFATISGPAVIQAKAQGADVVIIGSPYNLMPYSLVVHGSIRSPSDLKGKRVAIARFGGITEVAARLAFDKLGLNPKEVTMMQAGPDGQRLAAVQSGAVAGTLIGPPVLFAAVSQGLKIMLDLADVGVPYPMGTIVTSRSYQAQNRPLTKRFLMAFVEGLRHFVDHKDFALKVMQKYTRLSDQDVLSKSYDYFARRTALAPFTDPAVLKNVLPADRASGRNVEDYYDNSVLQELVNERFLAKDAKQQK
jgi:ABC-type nitrate/sulfonate/bicarbonate transport system substrate-binding protein